MGLQVVGAGLGRTGTHSLKLALEQLLGGSCYHMLEIINRPDRAAAWAAAVRGEEPDWSDIFDGYVAAVDWPAAAFWRELSHAFPDAVVVLSTRDPASWWDSASQTIFSVLSRGAPADDPGAVAELDMITDLMATRFTADWHDRTAAVAAYEAHNAEVRASVPPGRLVEWRGGDGWEPLCRALGVPVPAAPFPHVNTSAEFRAFTGLDGGSAAEAG